MVDDRNNPRAVDVGLCEGKKERITMNIKKGDTFYAIVKKGPHSKTLGGEEKAGRKLGPFVADAVCKYGSVEADIYRFSPTDWFFVKVGEDNNA